MTQLRFKNDTHVNSSTFIYIYINFVFICMIMSRYFYYTCVHINSHIFYARFDLKEHTRKTKIERLLDIEKHKCILNEIIRMILVFSSYFIKLNFHSTSLWSISILNQKKNHWKFYRLAFWLCTPPMTSTHNLFVWCIEMFSAATTIWTNKPIFIRNINAITHLFIYTVGTND